MLLYRLEALPAFEATNRVSPNTRFDRHSGRGGLYGDDSGVRGPKPRQAVIDGLNQARNILNGDIVRGDMGGNDIANVDQ